MQILYNLSTIVIFEHTQRMNDQYIASMTLPLPYPTILPEILVKINSGFEEFQSEFLDQVACGNPQSASVATTQGAQNMEAQADITIQDFQRCIREAI